MRKEKGKSREANAESRSLIQVFHSSLVIALCICVAAANFYSQTGGAFTIEKSAIAAGGGQHSTGGNFSLDGTIGQPIAGNTSTGSTFSVSGGFWHAVFNPNGVVPPAIFKSFSPSSINVNETTTLTITLVNPSSNAVALTGVGVTDAFPSGMQVNAVPAAANTCSGTFTAQVGASSISLTDGVIAIGSFCTVSVTVKTTTAGEKINTTGTVTSTNGGTGGTATATLSVNQPTATNSVSGTISYGITSAGQSPSPVSGVSLNAAGSSTLSTTNDLSGNYQLSGLTSGGNYTVTPSKTGEVKGINSLDATRIQQHRVGLITLTPNQLIAADTDGSGTVNSLDATRIQQRLVGINSNNIIGQWKFVPASRQYNSINSNRTGENYEAVLVGEVSGNWATASSFAEETDGERFQPDQQSAADVADRFEQKPKEHRWIPDEAIQSVELPLNESKSESAIAGASVAVSLPANASAANSNPITIPVTIGALPAGTSIESFDFTVFYDPAVLQLASPVGSNAGTLSSGCSVLANSPISGRVIFSGACAQAITTTTGGVLYNLQFTVIGSAGQTSALSFINPANSTNTFQFNNGSPAAKTTNGSFMVFAPTAAKVSVSGRVLTNTGRGIRNVAITLTDSNGNQRTAVTTSFGYYHFDSIEAGETVTIIAKARRFKFNQSTIVRMTNESIADADFIAQE